MRIEINIYDSNRGGGFSYYRESYDVETFVEYKKSILDTYARAEGEGIIALTAREGLWGEQLVWAPCEDEDRDIEVSTTVNISEKTYNLFGCTVHGEEINFPTEGYDVALEWENSYKEDLGSLDFKPEDFDGEEFIEKLFNFYLTKA